MHMASIIVQVIFNNGNVLFSDYTARIRKRMKSKENEIINKNLIFILIF